jgi:hypothetical protein
MASLVQIEQLGEETRSASAYPFRQATDEPEVHRLHAQLKCRAASEGEGLTPSIQQQARGEDRSDDEPKSPHTAAQPVECMGARSPLSRDDLNGPDSGDRDASTDDDAIKFPLNSPLSSRM